ncbi:hypothetical protein IC617_12625 [Neiella sp. HB171785]|uniref:Uncharacterized protein n=1 Tax=Neiella litorisoli TaxID=2771431 RepID=A0A8J6QJJ7_9GAMM|nr:hypothetical protein [Neiella litorisoli]MBD1390279.1 hypothetical protein [Neiella litorisoli]
MSRKSVAKFYLFLAMAGFFAKANSCIDAEGFANKNTEKYANIFRIERQVQGAASAYSLFLQQKLHGSDLEAVSILIGSSFESDFDFYTELKSVDSEKNLNMYYFLLSNELAAKSSLNISYGECDLVLTIELSEIIENNPKSSKGQSK